MPKNPLELTNTEKDLILDGIYFPQHNTVQYTRQLFDLQEGLVK